VRRIAPVIVLVVALAGCGTTDDRDQARAATARFLDAVRRHDGALACRELTAAAAQALADQEGKPCDQAVGELQLDGGAITGVEVYMTNAKADLTSHESVFLDRGPSGWKLSAVGCAHDDKPADHPFTCELEA
jgi:uncharacterized lipoprotein NlpE involved in copper resistance